MTYVCDKCDHLVAIGCVKVSYWCNLYDKLIFEPNITSCNNFKEYEVDY